MDHLGAQPLEEARLALDMTVESLWMQYVALGGSLTVETLRDFLEGRRAVGRMDYDVLVQALNEIYLERGEDYPIPYSDGLDT